MIGKRRILILFVVVALGLSGASSPVEAQHQTVGLFLNETSSFDGYTLFTPLSYGTTYLIDNDGRLVHSWDTGAGISPYLLDDGSLMLSANFPPNPAFPDGGVTGGVRQFAWDGTLTWEFQYSGPDRMAHHDIEVLPNGNVLMIAWGRETADEAIAAGRNPALLQDDEVRPLHIIEVEPTGASDGEIVWEWHAWDHLIQDHDPEKNNYGIVANNPELIDINYIEHTRPAGGEADWHHTNAIDYSQQYDQILVSVRHFSEIWVIDHSTTTAEASGHTGGNGGKGGDLLYRWGNPQAYGAGDASDQKFFLQHDARWIESGLPGEGNILVFNNGNDRPGGNYSSVDEIVPPVDSFGNYSFTPGQAFAPAELEWTYQAPNPTDFFSFFISGAIRLPNNNTLIDSGAQGTLFEVNPEGDIVWKYISPVTNEGPLTQGQSPQGNFVFRALRYSPDFPGLVGKDLTPGGPVEIVDIPDFDHDGLTDQEEIDIYGTNPLLADTDLDGCVDGAEVLNGPSTGGGRDPLNFWDLFDVWTGSPPVRGGAVGGADIAAVVLHFGLFQDPPPTEAEALAEALTPPASQSVYHASYDRGGSFGPNVWNLKPPDGGIGGGDIVAMVLQFGHNCN